MKLLFLAPLPPPTTGHSLISKALIESLAGQHVIEVVDLSAGSQHDGSVSLKRIKEVLKVLKAAFARRDADVIYLTISETLAGNLKDLVIYLVCLKRLRNTVVHLHGGSIDQMLFRRFPFVRRLNAYFLSRAAAVVVSGPAHTGIFSSFVAPGRIREVFNFASEELFISRNEVVRKFDKIRPLRVLYLSGMSVEKGCFDLLSAYEQLAPDEQQMIQLDFAGRFDSDADRNAFLERSRAYRDLRYHGVVGNDRKRELFAQAHLFCLPSRMFEGQPISILEAYASGCVVIASSQPGIRDIFADRRNGFEIAPGRIGSIAAALRSALRDKALGATAASNREEAGKRYTRARYVKQMEDILSSAAER